MLPDPTFRPATRADAGTLTILIDIAGNALANQIWLDAAGPGQSAIEVGRHSVLQDTGVDSYRNATIAIVGDEVAGCMIGGLPERLYDFSRIEEKPALFRPVARLASQAAGSWYIDVIASFAEFRGCGLGSKLLALATSKARDAGAPENSLVVGSWNEGAERLYARCGFSVVAREPAVLPENYPQSGEWMLMTRPLK
ncbi:MAG: GNAT family N-acetyltransferase [Pseudomonadota bacterium]